MTWRERVQELADDNKRSRKNMLEFIIEKEVK